MSKGFFGHSSLFHRDPAAARPATSTSTPASRPRPHEERDQVSALYELGLLDDSGKRTRRRAATTGGQEHPGGARVAGSRTHTPTHTSTRSYPNPNPLGAHPQGGLGPQKSTQRPIPILTSPSAPLRPLTIRFLTFITSRLTAHSPQNPHPISSRTLLAFQKRTSPSRRRYRRSIRERARHRATCASEREAAWQEC
jgi:hypothetical protein